MDDETRLIDFFPRLPSADRLMCSTWYGYCAGCLLRNCPDRAELFGKPRQRPKPKEYPPPLWGDA